MSAWQRLPRIQLPASRSRSYLPPCLVARAGRKRLPAFHRSPKTNVERVKSHIRAKNELTLYSPSGQKNVGALVVNMTGDVRRVAKSRPVPREEVSRIRQTKYADSSHSNTRTSQGTLGQGVAALQNTLVQKYCEILPHSSAIGFKQQQDWRAHKYASKDVQKENDIKAVVMEAIKKDWRLLQEASDF